MWIERGGVGNGDCCEERVRGTGKGRKECLLMEAKFQKLSNSSYAGKNIIETYKQNSKCLSRLQMSVGKN